MSVRAISRRAGERYRIIKELQPDVLHGHGAKGGVYARMFGSLLRVSRSRVARVYTAHGGSLHYDEATVTGKLFFALERLMMRFTDCILFVSDYERRAFRHKVGEPRPPNSLVHNGLREAEFETCRVGSGRRGFPLYRHDARPEGSGPVHRCAGAGGNAAGPAGLGSAGRRRRGSAALRSAGAAAWPRRSCPFPEADARAAGLRPGWDRGGPLPRGSHALYRARSAGGRKDHDRYRRRRHTRDNLRRRARRCSSGPMPANSPRR